MRLPLAADLCPTGKFTQDVSERFQRAGDINALRTDLGTLSAADAGRGTFIIRKCVDRHRDVNGGADLVIVVEGQQQRDVQSGGTAVAAVTAGGAGNGSLHGLGNLEVIGNIHPLIKRGEQPAEVSASSVSDLPNNLCFWYGRFARWIYAFFQNGNIRLTDFA